jgi:hypothetical protein
MPVDAAGNQVQYVIHRLCNLPGAYDNNGNRCRTTAPRPSAGGAVQLGTSLVLGRVQLASSAQIHYLVTARVFGPRGGNVVTQTVIMRGP